MRNRLSQYKSLPLLAYLLTLFAFGCTSGEQGGNGAPDLPEMVETELRIGVSDASRSLQTKATDANALPGEQIHSLAVFIVNASGTVEKKFQPNLTSDAQAQTGDLESWRSGSFEITAGTKTIYAFANWESLKNYTFISTEEGTTLSLPTTVECTSESLDPANGTYLPMSVQESWVPEKGVKTISLVRLVSRLKVNMRNRTSHAINVTGLTLGAFNTAGNLFEQSTSLATSGNGYTIQDILKDNNLAATDGTASSPWFYVNESEAANGFKVDLSTSSNAHQTDDNLHAGTKFTALRHIPRNHIWNLNIEFTSYKLTLLSVSNENPPIGGYPESSTNSDGITDLVCTVRGGGPFTITIKELVSQDGVNANQDISKDVTWSIGNVNKGDLLAETPNDVSTKDTQGYWQITGGRMVGAATEEQSASFELIARKDGAILATFQIQLKFADLFSEKTTVP